MSIRNYLGAAALAATCLASSAAPVRWSVDGLSLTDGSTVTGGFTYDASLDLVSSISILLTTGSPGSPFTLTNQFFPSLGGTYFLFTETAAADYTGQATLWITVSSALTDAGGSASINLANGYGWGVCSIPSCNSASNPGDLTGALFSVPTPGSAALVAAALLGAAGARRRKAKA
jgi:MYXO-CTERM domain-containing protein